MAGQAKDAARRPNARAVLQSALRRIRLGSGMLAVILVTGCQPAVRLMPAPAVFASGEHSPFAVNPSLEKSNQVEVFYATNRLPVGPRGSRVYTILPGQSLYLGTAAVRIGPRGKTWEDLYAASTRPAKGIRPVLRLESLDEMAKIRGDEDPASLTPEARGFFEAINQALARSLAKDLTIYVHGANTNVEIALAQAAQYRHFTGRNSVVLAFAWPSGESGLRYLTDVRNARVSVPVFAHLIDLLARHTAAEQINVLAYSAGAQVASPGLAGLRPNDSGAGMRLGEVYLAAPDVSFPAFAAQLPRYIHLARRVTVSVNLNDSVLGLSQWFHGVSRLGRPDPTELSEQDSRWLIEAAARIDFDLISVQPEAIPGLSRRSHSFWYDHPWVSSDVMIKLLFHIPPAERGLEQNWTDRRFEYWTFPANYERRVTEILRTLRAGRLPAPSKPGFGVQP